MMRPAALGLAALLLLGGSASAQTPASPDTSMDNLPSLRDQAPTSGTFRCPDGTTRTYTEGPPSDLLITMKCSGPPANADGKTPGQVAIDAKNAAAEQQAALSGQSGVKAGLEATAKTGRLDFLLRQPLVWGAGLILAFAAAGWVLTRLLGGKK